MYTCREANLPLYFLPFFLMGSTLNSFPVGVDQAPRFIKTFFVLSSIEHEILNAHKYKNIKKFGFF